MNTTRQPNTTNWWDVVVNDSIVWSQNNELAWIMTLQQMEFKKPNMIQRMKCNKDWSFGYDYMWSSQFETWCVWRSIAKIIEYKKEWTLVEFETPSWAKWYCHISVKEETIEQIEWIIEWKYNLLEPTHIWSDIIYEYNKNFLCLDNDYFFSLDGNEKRFVTYLDSVNQKKDFLKQVKEDPRYIELDQLCKNVYAHLRTIWIDITYIWVQTSRLLTRLKHMDISRLTDKDFKNLIWINSSDQYICNSCLDKEDLQDALQSKWQLFTDTYWLSKPKPHYLNVANSKNRKILKDLIDIFNENYEKNNLFSDKNWDIEWNNIVEVINALCSNDALDRKLIDKLVFSKSFDMLLQYDSYFIYLINWKWLEKEKIDIVRGNDAIKSDLLKWLMDTTGKIDPPLMVIWPEKDQKKRYKVWIEMEGYGENGEEITWSDLWENIEVEAANEDEARDIVFNKMDFGNRRPNGYSEVEEIGSDK